MVVAAAAAAVVVVDVVVVRVGLVCNFGKAGSAGSSRFGVDDDDEKKVVVVVFDATTGTE